MYAEYPPPTHERRPYFMHLPLVTSEKDQGLKLGAKSEISPSESSNWEFVQMGYSQRCMLVEEGTWQLRFLRPPGSRDAEWNSTCLDLSSTVKRKTGVRFLMDEYLGLVVMYSWLKGDIHVVSYI